MRILTGLAALAALLLPATASAQDDSNARILAAVDTFFAGFNSGNTELTASVLVDGTGMVSLFERDGPDQVRTEAFAATLARMAERQVTLNEVYWDPIVLVQGPIAVVWAPYSIDVNGARSHCGIDVFNLLRVDDEWKISGIQYTMDPDGCPEGR